MPGLHLFYRTGLALILFISLAHAGDLHLCTRVIDGDTIVVSINGTKETVRLIGVDTPETVDPRSPVEPGGPEASAFTKKMVEGQMVRLEYDKQRRGKYGRLLAYVYLQDGTMLNTEIIRQGYGRAYLKYPFSMKETFRDIEGR
jgi:micrococcal nuclease